MISLGTGGKKTRVQKEKRKKEDETRKQDRRKHISNSRKKDKKDTELVTTIQRHVSSSGSLRRIGSELPNGARLESSSVNRVLGPPPPKIERMRKKKGEKKRKKREESERWMVYVAAVTRSDHAEGRDRWVSKALHGFLFPFFILSGSRAVVRV